MNYRLIVLTHGDSAPLEQCLDSFGEHVQPLPSELHILRDGPGYSYVPPWADRFSARQIAVEPVGFCRAVGYCWRVGADAGVDYVYWLEHDFVHTRPADLRELAMVLEGNHQLVQMALMRDAVNEQEKAAGGLFESRCGEYERRALNPRSGITHKVPAGLCNRIDWPPWLEHRSYFTTNPSLMRREFMAAYPWPDYVSECEGRFGIDLVQAGFTFGVWGSGEPWVEHIGVRTGFGY